MRTVYFNLTEKEIKELDKQRFNENEEEDLQNEIWTQQHLIIVESEKLGGETAINIQ